MRLLIPLILCICAFDEIFAQHVQTIEFTETTHDFGLIKEVDGPVTHEFKFTNNGTEPLTITNVKTSCGCTTPGWTKEAVSPGETGFIQAQYNPTNRPGRFNKSLTISNSISDPIRLYIRGEVSPKQKSPEEELPTELGALRMQYRSLNMGKVYVNREAITKKFKVYNQSEQDVIISKEIKKPDHIAVEFDADTIRSKKTTYLSITYDAGLKDDLGFMNDSFEFQTNEPDGENIKQITVFASLQEYFPPLNAEELAKAPRLEIEQATVDLGRLKNGEKVKKTISLSNIGGSELSIRKLSPNCTCLSASIKNNSIESGGKENLEIVFDSNGRIGNQQKSLTVYSNDPKQSAQRITIKAYVEEK